MVILWYIEINGNHSVLLFDTFTASTIVVFCKEYLQLWIKQFHPQLKEHTLNFLPSEALKKYSVVGPDEKTADWPHSLLFIHDLISSLLSLDDAVLLTLSHLWVTVVQFTVATPKSMSDATNSADSVTRDPAATLWRKNLWRHKRTLFRVMEIPAYKLYKWYSFRFFCVIQKSSRVLWKYVNS